MANEKRLIDANAFKDNFSFLRKMWSETEIGAVIDNAPTVDAVEVKHGRWIEGLDGSCMCSNCNRVIRYEIGYYCPNCGAKMIGGKEDGLL